ncbi:AraC family transcriptional regulator [uncultured Dubosiella sp.]
MLLATKDPIESIARQVGYTSPDTFTKVFKKETGMTPTHYRRLNQNF